MDAIRAELARLPGVQYDFSRPALLSFSSPLQVEISGYDLDALAGVSEAVIASMTKSDRFTDIKTTVERGNPEIQIVFDQERASKLGLAVRDIANRVVANVRGELATRYTWRDRKIDVLVRSVDASASSIDEIRRLIVNPMSDRPVTLDAVATVVVSKGPAEIRRVAQERVAIITANVAYGDLGAAAEEAGVIVSRIPLPTGITAMVSGQSEEMQASFESMQFALVLAIFLVYLVMASQFESLIHPFVILFTIPLALVGAVLALFVTGTTVNIVALIGVIMLAGIVVNNAIVLVDLINQLRAQGVDRHDAIMQAGEARLRPILMTSLTTALGLLPMAMGFGEGSEVRTPMAITVIGGLVVSTLLTLLVIPVVYSLMDKKALASRCGSIDGRRRTMRHTEIALRRPVTTVVVFVALALVGTIAARLLPLEKFPDIEFPGIFIQVPYPGSTPEEVESLITRPVEEALATLSGVEQMFSSSSEGQSQIFLQFGWDQSMGAKGIEARAKVDGIRHLLPDDVRRIFVFTGSLGDQPVLQLRISSERDLSDSYDLLDRLLKRRLERIEGVSRVELHGVDPREIRILMKPDMLAAHGVDIATLRDLLVRSNFAVSAGKITAGDQRLSVRPSGEFSSVEEIRELVINPSGLRLRDVADIELRTPERDYGRHLDRDYAIGVAINKATGSNLVDVTDRVIAEVEKVSELPQMQGINIFALENQGESVRESLSDLLKAGAIGGLLAIIVLYLFLRQATTTLIVTASVPFSLMITLGALYFAGLTLNILSMMGLMLAVGMLVDNAVVITESIFRHRAEKPGEPFTSTIAGVREVGMAVIAGTATTIIVFAPIIFGAQTDMTIFLTHVAVTIIVALIASLVIAQTLVPMLAARVAVPPQPKKGAWISRLTNRYVASLKWILSHRWWSGLGIVMVCVIGVLPMALDLVKFDMFPQDVGRRLYMPYHIEGQHPLEQVESAVDTIEDYLYSHQEELNIRSVYSYYRQDHAESLILLTEEEDATFSTREIIERIEKDMPTLAIGKPSFKFDQQGGGEGFTVQVSGDSTAVLNTLSVDVVRALSTVEGLKNVRSDAETGDRKYRLVLTERERQL